MGGIKIYQTSQALSRVAMVELPFWINMEAFHLLNCWKLLELQAVTQIPNLTDLPLTAAED